jgi:hypothetical protein
LQDIARILFFENTADGFEEGDLLVLQWLCMGRAGETRVRHSAFRYIGKPTCAIRISVGRTKTTTLQDIHAFCDSDSWYADVFHAMGSHLATSTSIDDQFHFKNASAHAINKILTKVTIRTIYICCLILLYKIGL